MLAAQPRAPEPSDFGNGGDRSPIYENTLTGELFYFNDGQILPIMTNASLAAPPGSSLVGFLQAGAGMVATDLQTKNRQIKSVFDAMSASQIADVISGTLSVDVTAAVQKALTAAALLTGVDLIFPAGLYKITDYLTVSNAGNLRIIMQGVLVPTGTLNTLTTGLLHFDTCDLIRIVPNIVNAAYASTLNCFYLSSCTNVQIVNGAVDVKYNAIDGSAGIQIGSNCSDITIANNKIRSGYGVLVNANATGVTDVDIVGNRFVGQTAYGNTGPGDAIEINAPTYGASNIRVIGNTFKGYTFVNAGRSIVCGFANVSGVLVQGNTFPDIVGMISIHAEDQTSYFSATKNIITSGHIGVHVSCNTARTLRSISVQDNTIDMPVLDAGATYATGAGIDVINNQVAGNGEILGLNVSNNTVTNTAGGAFRGIMIQDHRNGRIIGNTVKGFPQTGMQVKSGNASSAGVWDTIIEGNVSSGNATSAGSNYVFGRGAPGNSTVDTNTWNNVHVKNNTQDSATNQVMIEYYSASNSYIAPFVPVSTYKLESGNNVATDNTATTAFTITGQNASFKGQIRVKYNCYLTSGASGRICETGEYIFNVVRQTGANMVVAASSKFGNSQAAFLGSGSITVTLAAAAVSGGVTATNTIAIQYTCVDGTANSTKSGSEIEFVAEYSGNSSQVTLS